MAKTIRLIAAGFVPGCLVIAGSELLTPSLVLAGVAFGIAFLAHISYEVK